MRRALLDIVTAVSLLVATAAAGLWVRGYAVMDLVRVRRMDWDVLHNTVPESMTYVTNARGQITWTTRRDVPLGVAYLQRDFELHWQAGPLPPGNAAGDLWLGWVVMGAAALPAVRVGWWAWRRRGGRKRRGQGIGRVPGAAYGRWSALRVAVAARAVWLAAVAALGVGVFWVRSYPYFERVDWKLQSEQAGVQVNSSKGSLMVAWTNKGPNRMIARHDFAFIRTCKPPTRGPLYQAADLVGGYVQAAGFTLGTDASTTWPYNVLIVPYWFAEAVLLGAGAWAWRYVRRRSKRSEANLCARCGYDLRATPERCPECGLEPLRAPVGDRETALNPITPEATA